LLASAAILQICMLCEVAGKSSRLFNALFWNEAIAPMVDWRSRVIVSLFMKVISISPQTDQRKILTGRRGCIQLS
jgi:hypothetical protein